MPTSFDLQAALGEGSRTWLVTGAAGFIGSHLVERLLLAGQRVVGLDDFSTGRRFNIEDALRRGGSGAMARFRLVEGSVADGAACREACVGVERVLHQAALGSVPRSLKDPLATHRANVDGFITLLVAARDAGVKRFVYASSSSVYGDDPGLPKVEDRVGQVLSPYAATKKVNELYAQVFQRAYGLQCIGLRYFNVFGPRQDPQGAYAAVIPRWVTALARGERCSLNGDGSTSRDFCFVANAVQANLRAALVPDGDATGAVYNVAVGQKTSLLELHALLRERVAAKVPSAGALEPSLQPFRPGDIKDSLADISQARSRLGYGPTHTIAQGLDETVAWYLSRAEAP
jgi:UDP-N-acetylglucosamine/UDP-N-acetylgalactosamine 4-epimerase